MFLWLSGVPSCVPLFIGVFFWIMSLGFSVFSGYPESAFLSDLLLSPGSPGAIWIFVDPQGSTAHRPDSTEAQGPAPKGSARPSPAPGTRALQNA